MADAGIELMAIATWHPFKTRRRVADLVRETIDATNVKAARGQIEGANYESPFGHLPFARKPQISLGFGPSKSNGRDLLKGARAPAGQTPPMR